MKNPEEELPSLEKLDEHIKRVKRASEEEKTAVPASAGKSVALRSGTELVAGVGVGAFIGYQLDSWLGTRPWLLILLIFLGFAGGVMNIYRAAMKDSKFNRMESRPKDGIAAQDERLSHKKEDAGE